MGSVSVSERLLGYLSESMIGKSVDFVSPHDRTGEISRIMARIKAGQPVQPQETMCVRSDATAIRVWLTVSPIRGTKGSIVGTSVIIGDLSQQKIGIGGLNSASQTKITGSNEHGFTLG